MKCLRLPRRLLAALLAPLSAACSSTGGGRPPNGPMEAATRSTAGPRRALAAARARWEAQPFQRYRITLRRSCECLPEASQPLRLTVGRRDGTVAASPVEIVESATNVRTGEPVSLDALPAADWTVAALFGHIAHALDDGAAVVAVEYDASLGYPRRVFIDPDAGAADEEVSYDASDLEPVP